MRIAVITVGELNCPSTHYRIGQYLPLLNRSGIECHLFPKNNVNFNDLNSFDLIINQKSLLKPKKIERFKILFDFDDAIWTRSGKGYSLWTKWRVEARLQKWLEGSVAVTVANRYLQKFADKFTKRVHCLPMALDLNLWRPPSKHPSRFVIGWSGHPVNIHYLEKLESVLFEILQKYPHVQLAVHSGARPKWSLPYKYVPYESGQETAFIQSLSLGLLPLVEDAYTRGKSPIKALQYLACAVPLVGNRFGATEEIHCSAHGVVVEQLGWKEALCQAIESPLKLRFLGEQGRGFIERHHDKDLVGYQLVQLIKNLIEEGNPKKEA